MAECIEEFNEFLIEAAGTSGQVLNSLPGREGVAFFKPYRDAADFGIRAATILSAPIASAIMAAETFGLSLYTAVISLVEVCEGKTDKACDAIVMSGQMLLMTLAAVVSVFISSLVNLVDLIGSGIATAIEGCAEKSELQMGM